MKIWIVFTIFITGCTPVSSHYQSTNTVNMPHPVNLCRIQKNVENSDAVTTKILHDISTTLNYSPKTSYTFNNIGDTSLSLPFDLQYNSEKNLSIMASILSEIKTQLQKINDNQKEAAVQNQEKKGEKTLEQLKKLLLASIPFFLFLWGLINYRTSEARAKVATLAPLLEKASDAIKTASEKFNSSGSINENDLQEFTIPMLNLERALRDTTPIDYIIEQNNDVFRSIRALMPAKVIIEIKNKYLLSKLQLSLAANLINHTYIGHIISELSCDYKIIDEKLLAEKRSYFSFKKVLFDVFFTIAFIGIFSIYLIAVAFYNK